MLWLFFSGLFIWLIFRESYYSVVAPAGFDKPHSPVSIPYIAILTLLAAAFAYPPVSTWQFERFLTKQARILSGSAKASVHCNSVGDTFFGPNVFAAGHAQPETGEIVFAILGAITYKVIYAIRKKPQGKALSVYRFLRMKPCISAAS